MSGNINKASECSRPGVCNCLNMPRCARCGYTAHDAAHLMDHRLPFCGGEIPEKGVTSRDNKVSGRRSIR